MPFHYGDWDEPGRRAAANRLTISGWDPVSKQPHFKYAAVRCRPTGKRTAAGDERETRTPPPTGPTPVGGRA